MSSRERPTKAFSGTVFNEFPLRSLLRTRPCMEWTKHAKRYHRSLRRTHSVFTVFQLHWLRIEGISLRPRSLQSMTKSSHEQSAGQAQEVLSPLKPPYPSWHATTQISLRSKSRIPGFIFQNVCTPDTSRCHSAQPLRTSERCGLFAHARLRLTRSHLRDRGHHRHAYALIPKLHAMGVARILPVSAAQPS